MLTPAFWPEVRRGTERTVHELSRRMIDRGHDTFVLTSRSGRGGRGEVEGVPVRWVRRLPAARLDRRAYESYLTHLPQAYLALMRADVDLAHAWFTTDALAAARWRRRCDRPVVHSYMGIPDHAGLMYFRHRLGITRRALAETDVTVALSLHAARQFERWLGYEAPVIPPPVDVARFSPGGVRAEVPTVVCAADAHDARKRVGMLVAAFRRVRRERPDARLLLDERTAGRLSDPERGIDAVDMTDLPGLYRSAWVSVLPSFGEAFGMVLAEAMACGTPAVGTREGGIPEVVPEGTGILFDGGEEELAEALLAGLELAEDPSTAQRCRDRALQLSGDRAADAYEALYRSLL